MVGGFFRVFSTERRRLNVGSHRRRIARKTGPPGEDVEKGAPPNRPIGEGERTKHSNAIDTGTLPWVQGLTMPMKKVVVVGTLRVRRGRAKKTPPTRGGKKKEPSAGSVSVCSGGRGAGQEKRGD